MKPGTVNRCDRLNCAGLVVHVYSYFSSSMAHLNVHYFV